MRKFKRAAKKKNTRERSLNFSRSLIFCSFLCAALLFVAHVLFPLCIHTLMILTVFVRWLVAGLN